MKKYKLLDLYCGAGGASAGYMKAGFHVTGIDIHRQPHYIGNQFLQTDALSFLADHGKEFDAIHASPPCQSSSNLRFRWHGRVYVDLIEATRELLIEAGKPYILENVRTAPLVEAFILCGTMFPGLKVLRHRKFEASFFVFQPEHRKHEDSMKVGHRGHQRPGSGGFITVTGHHQSVKLAREAMGIDWMNQYELSQAIPPAYTEYIGRQLMQILINKEGKK